MQDTSPIINLVFVGSLTVTALISAIILELKSQLNIKSRQLSPNLDVIPKYYIMISLLFTCIYLIWALVISDTFGSSAVVKYYVITIPSILINTFKNFSSTCIALMVFKERKKRLALINERERRRQLVILHAKEKQKARQSQFLELKIEDLE